MKVVVPGTLVWVTHPFHIEAEYPPYLGMEYDGYEHLIFFWKIIGEDNQVFPDLKTFSREPGDHYYWSQPPEEWK